MVVAQKYLSNGNVTADEFNTVKTCGPPPDTP